MPSELMIDALGLTRRYGDRLAVGNINFTVSRDEVFGFLGPNSAGKSTAVRMLTGDVPPSAKVPRLGVFAQVGLELGEGLLDRIEGGGAAPV